MSTPPFTFQETGPWLRACLTQPRDSRGYCIEPYYIPTTDREKAFFDHLIGCGLVEGNVDEGYTPRFDCHFVDTIEALGA